ncbi:DUF2997 domain-containing protein [Treponema primitia]|uniref:DUF2997 domain-containing protein n=1 Tax=Treponema primitia TaxID=88058 RepID=UPI00397F1F8C
MEQRIDITIDGSGKIHAATEGIKGEMCLDELTELLGEMDGLESLTRTDEYYQKSEVGEKSRVRGRQG